jgi:hypothetical protein
VKLFLFGKAHKALFNQVDTGEEENDNYGPSVGKKNKDFDNIVKSPYAI